MIEQPLRLSPALALLALVTALLLSGCGTDERTSARPAARAIAGTWTEGPSLLEARAEIVATVLDGQIYTGGGFDAAGRDLGSFEVLNPAVGAWEARAPAPLALNHLGIAAAGGQIFLSGGTLSVGGRGQISNAFFAYDPATDRWTRLADMPLRRSAHVMVAVGDSLFVIGGVGEEPRVMLEYALGTGTWQRRAPLPAEREHLSAAVVEGRIYVIGGRWGGRGNLTTVEVYDPATDTWEGRAPLPTSRGGLTAAAVDGRIHVVGGEGFDPTRTFEEHEIYTPATDSWESAPPLPAARHGLASVGLDGRFWVIGGGRIAGLSVSNLVEVFTPE